MRNWFLLLVLTIAIVQDAFASSARVIPVAKEVDVLVVGGSSGAVAAAVEAAKAGASVFLAAPRTYLGDDMAGTLRLWLEPGEQPTTDLARQIYNDTLSPDRAGVPFTYGANQPSQGKHRDTIPPKRLYQRTPGFNAQVDSVEYANDVCITADLGLSRHIESIEVTTFIRQLDFQAKSIHVEVSEDGSKWANHGNFTCAAVGGVARTIIPLDVKFRHARIVINKTEGAKRLLVGGIRFLAPAVLPRKGEPVVTRPMHVKKTFENALESAKVDFLYGCYPTDVLMDKEGQPAGVVMANRAGRQAITAKVIIDATENATVAKLAGTAFTRFVPGEQVFKWVTIAGQQSTNAPVRKLPLPATVYGLKGDMPTGEKAWWFEYTLTMDLPDETWSTRADIEQEIRDLTYVHLQHYSSDMPFTVPQRAIRSRKVEAQQWQGPEKLDLRALRPKGVNRMWVLSGCADLSRKDAEKLLRPVVLMQVGSRVGVAAAKQASSSAKPEGIKVRILKDGGQYAGDVREALEGLRPSKSARKISEEAHSVPVLGNYDVVVVGGGTSGAAAGIGAARQGAKTLVIEYLHGLGGVGTLGMIGKYWYGNRVGFTATVPQNPTEVRMEFLRSELRQAGADIWFGCIGSGALVQSNNVKGVVVTTPFGRGIVSAKVVIDGSGNADVAAVAGAQTTFVEDDFALQASHMPPREVGAYYINGDIPAVDVADPLDVRQALQRQTQNYFDRSPLVDSRERRRVVGDYCLDWLDQINNRTFPDTIALAQSDYDSHGYQIHPFFMLRPARVPGDYKRQFYSYVPYRCLLPKGLENMLVVGLGLSAHRDAMPIVRMQPDLQNIGYAAGVAAATSVKNGTTPRQVDVKALQKHLVDLGNLSESVLGHNDLFPLPQDRVAAAVSTLTNDYAGLEIVLAHPDAAKRILHDAYAKGAPREKLMFAHVLGIMGDATGLETLIEETQRQVENSEFIKVPVGDKSVMDDVTRLIWALGGSRDRRSVSAICSLGMRVANTDFRRFRAVVITLGRLADPSAAPTLSELLSSKAKQNDVGELIAACALYRCGDKDGQAQKTLERFVSGNNGPYSKLASQVLAQK